MNAIKNHKLEARRLRKLIREALDFWARPETDMPHVELFDAMVRATGWKHPEERGP